MRAFLIRTTGIVHAHRLQRTQRILGSKLPFQQELGWQRLCIGQVASFEGICKLQIHA